MRIDLPSCSFKNCKYCSDGNCINRSKYENCDYKVLKDEFVSGQLALQKEIEKLDALLVCKNKVIRGLEKSFENAYDEAIKEFAERLKRANRWREEDIYYIDTLVEIMVGDDK